MPPNITTVLPKIAALWWDILGGIVPLHCTYSQETGCVGSKMSSNSPLILTFHILFMGPYLMSLPPWMYKLKNKNKLKRILTYHWL